MAIPGENTGKYPEKAPNIKWEEQDKDKGSEAADSIGKARLDSLKETVEEIMSLIKERGSLSEYFIKEAEGMKTNINNFLLENAPQGEDDSEFTRERAELRKKQIDISELQLNERVGCWRDIALLKRELRDRETELSEREGRAEIIGKILEE